MAPRSNWRVATSLAVSTRKASMNSPMLATTASTVAPTRSTPPTSAP
jgi:hypothetical protein